MCTTLYPRDVSTLSGDPARLKQGWEHRLDLPHLTAAEEPNPKETALRTHCFLVTVVTVISKSREDEDFE